MPLKIYEYCEEIIKSKNKRLIIKDTKTNKNSLSNKSLINYKERVISKKHNLEIMNVIYDIYYEKGNLNIFKIGLMFVGLVAILKIQMKILNYLVNGVEK